VGKRADPFIESVAKRFLVSELGCDLPIGYSFAAFAKNGPRGNTFAFDCISDYGVIVYRFPALWAYDLVFHFVSFPGNLESAY
jgi:hypothetical protein